MGDEERKKCGMSGHEFVMSDDAMMSATAMSNLFIEHMDTAFEKWTPRKRFTMFKDRSYNETIDVNYRTVATRSGYGSHSRDLVRSLIAMDKFDIKINSLRWGNCPMNALDESKQRMLRYLVEYYYK